MAIIEKLGIQGIRAFDPDSLSVIEFETPITIIVGHNGAGKTTIIESLRMSTTGNATISGTAFLKDFIHDPKMDRVPEVRFRALKIRSAPDLQ